MNPLQAMILGLVQGVAEFLPISSSGHLIVFRSILGLGEVPVLFDILLHVSTLAAVCLVFRKLIARLCVSLFRFVSGKADDAVRADMGIVVALLVGSAATAGIGYFINKIDLEGQPKIVAGLLIVTAAILCLNLFFKGKKPLSGIGWKEGLIVGIAQGIGVFPGISRSGITITASTIAGIDREGSGEFSFLLSIPAVLGAFVLKLHDATNLGAQVAPLEIAIAMIMSFVIGTISLVLLKRIIKKGALAWFALYLVPAGLAGIFFLA
jgi:undecaprenyl-diphosphatase